MFLHFNCLNKHASNQQISRNFQAFSSTYYRIIYYTLSNLGDFSAPQSLSFWLSMIWQLPVMMDFAPVHPKHPKHPFRSMEDHWNTPFPKTGKERWSQPSTWLHKWFPWKVLYLQWGRSIASGFFWHQICPIKTPMIHQDNDPAKRSASGHDLKEH